MKHKFFLVPAIFLAMVAARASADDIQSSLLKTREAVWRAWFANDRKALLALVPAGTIVISSGEEKWKSQQDELQSAEQLQKDGGKLIRLEFPRTEIQRFGNVAILYSRYLLETEVHGKRSTSAGRATEVFVLRHGQWVNPGWHTDSEK